MSFATSFALSGPVEEIVLTQKQAVELGFTPQIESNRAYDSMVNLEITYPKKINEIDFYAAFALLSQDGVDITSNKVLNSTKKVVIKVNRAVVTNVKVSFFFGKFKKYIVSYDLNSI